MSWAEVSDLQDSMTDLALGKVLINCGPENAGKKALLKRYTSDYMVVDLDSQGSAEVDVTPKSRYELTNAEPDNWLSSDVFFINDGEIKTVDWHTGVQFDGATVLPINDVKTWLKCAGIWSYSLGGGYFNYTTIDQVLEDPLCISALINSKNAVEYMVRFTDDDIIVKLSNSSTFISFITKYASMRIGQTPIFCKIIAESGNSDIFAYGTLRTTSTDGGRSALSINGMTVSIESSAGNNDWYRCSNLGVLFDGFENTGLAGVGYSTYTAYGVFNEARVIYKITLDQPFIPKRFKYGYPGWQSVQDGYQGGSGEPVYIYGSIDDVEYFPIMDPTVPSGKKEATVFSGYIPENVKPVKYIKVQVPRTSTYRQTSSSGTRYQHTGAWCSEIEVKGCYYGEA